MTDIFEDALELQNSVQTQETTTNANYLMVEIREDLYKAYRLANTSDNPELLNNLLKVGVKVARLTNVIDKLDDELKGLHEQVEDLDATVGALSESLELSEQALEKHQNRANHLEEELKTYVQLPLQLLPER